MITFTFEFSVPPLTNSTVWFANAQAWKNYWDSAIGGTGEIDPITTTIYTPNVFVNGDPAIFDIDGTIYTVVTKTVFDSLVAQVAALDTAVQTMRDELKAAGLVTESQ